MKSACTQETNQFYQYGEGYYKNENLIYKERKELMKGKAIENLKNWEVKEINI